MNKKIRSICMSDKYWGFLRQIAEVKEVSMSKMLELLIKEYVENNK